MAAEGLERGQDGTVRFVLTDERHQVPVVFHGILPDLFREGQGIIAEGHVDREGVFEASEVLAKHDERYMPKDVAEALKRSGRLEGRGGDGNANDRRDRPLRPGPGASGSPSCRARCRWSARRGGDAALMALAPTGRAARSSCSSRSPSWR